MISTESGAPLAWRKSSLCAAGSCVEVAPLGKGMVAVRDGKVEEGPVLVYTPDEWSAFVAGVKAGEFDDLSIVQGTATR